MPHAARQAIRVNIQTLTNRLRLYQEGRKDILDQAVKDGLAKEDGSGRYIIALEHQQRVSGELQELAEVKNNLNIECFDVDPILQDSNLTLAEEDVLLLFRKEEKE